MEKDDPLRFQIGSRSGSIKLSAMNVMNISRDISRRREYAADNNDNTDHSDGLSRCDDGMAVVVNESGSLHKDIEHLDDIETMRIIISDLSRRLQNTHHTIQSQQDAANRAKQESDKYKSELDMLTVRYRFELAKNVNVERKYNILRESTKMNERRAVIDDMQQALRVKSIDQQIFKSKLKLDEMKKDKDAITKLLSQQEVSLKYVSRLKQQEALVEGLCQGCQTGDIKACREYIDNGLSVNEVDSAGFLPIDYACKYGFIEIVELLLKSGSDPGTYITGKNPIEIAAKYGFASIIQLLVNHNGNVDDPGGNEFPIITAVSSGQMECLEMLLALGADVNVRDSVGNNCLHIASKCPFNVSNCINLLLRYGADMSVINLEGFTPFQVAVNSANSTAITTFNSHR